MASGTRKAVVELGADPSRLDGALTTQRAKMKAWGQKIGTDLKRSMRGAFDSLGSIAGFGGVAGLAVMAKQTLEFEQRISRLGVASRSTAAQMGALKEQIFETAKARGGDAGDLLGGIESFVALTGDIGGAKQAMDAFAKVSTATGASVEDIAQAAAALRTNLGVGGDEMEQALATLASQGKSGAIELKDVARVASSLAPTFANFNNTGVSGLAEMGALLQVAKRGFSGAEETTTGLNSMMGSLLKKQKEVRKLIGDKAMFDVGPDGVRRMKSLSSIVFAIAEKTKGDPIAVQELLNDKESIRAFQELAKAGPDELDKLIAEQRTAGAELNANFKTMIETPAAKIARAKAQIDQTFNDFLAKNLDSIAGAFQKIADVLEWMISHKAEVAAMFLAVKGGGYLSGLAGAAGGGGVGGGLAGMAGIGGSAPGGGGRAGRVMGAIGGMMQGAAIGGAAVAAFGKDLDGTTQGLVVATHALAGLPGPIGLIGKSASILIDGVMAGFSYLNGELDAKQKKHENAKFRELDSEQMKGFNTGDAASKKKAARYLLYKAAEVGALTKGEDGQFKVNNEALSKSLATQSTYGASGQAVASRTINDAVGFANANPGDMQNIPSRALGWSPEQDEERIRRARVKIDPIEVRVVDGNVVAAQQNDRGRRRRGD